ncbi:MAG TPA: AMP-binding protein [Solirubrobacteraceae bacterium]
MNEQSTTSGHGASPAQTLCEAFQATAARVPDRVALRTPGDQDGLSWGEYATAVQRTAGALAALGVGRGDRVAYLSRNRPELAIAEVAGLHLGAAGVVLYTASPSATIAAVLSDSEPRVLIVESALLGRLSDLEHTVKHVLVLDSDGEREHVDGVAALPSVEPPSEFDFNAAWQAVSPDDLAAILYTSGTTGTAKGVECTHRTATAWIYSFDSVWPEADGIHDISYGSFANVGERGCGHWRALALGSTRTICLEPKQLPAALLDARPTFLFGPPQVWQALKRALESSLDTDERAALDAGIQRTRTLVQGQPADALSAEQEAILAALRRRVGLERVNKSLCAAAPCPPALREHYHALGVPFAENFAMTEIGSASMQRPGLIDYGTLGAASPGYQLRIAEDGELLVRGPYTAVKYRNRPQETAETFDADGWVHTGDLGKLDAEGRLRLTGRKKEMIVPEHGHNVAPAQLESALMDRYPLILNACVIGNGRPHLSVLVAVAPEREQDDEARSAVSAAITQVNTGLDPREQIQSHAIVAEPWLPGDLLTETLKLRRRLIAERYADTIEQMYRVYEPTL